METVSLYVHIPFCQKKCYYCDFLSFSGALDQVPLYLHALEKEMEHYQPLLQGKEVKSIFIGGGTPSLLEASQTESLMEKLHQHFHIQKDAEITMECNPGTLTKEKAMAYRKAGINRISMGLQSMDNRLLSTLGRIHTAQTFESNFYMLREIGYDNINIDLMFGLPNQSPEEFADTLKRVVHFGPEHISAYGLIIEEGTPFYDQYHHNALNLTSDEEERHIYWDTHDFLLANGYSHYEISNFAKPGYECQHNLVYWTLEDYLGLGLGAASYFQNERFENISDLSQYIQAAGNAKHIIHSKHFVGQKESIEEFMFLGLRLLKGIHPSRFKERYGKTMESVYGQTLKRLKQEELLIEKQDILQLTKRGIDLSNHVFSELLLED